MSEAQLIAALNTYFSDTSRTPAETREGLQRFIDEAEMLKDTLPKGD